jgi:NAD(P)-dependent dehydrogenase (short-subunit alcohol dehydrogenase family)
MPTALVTGVSRGLGRALARSLAADRWRLVVDARTGPELDAAAAELAAAGADVAPLVGDVADPAHRIQLAAVAGDRLDLLALNASSLGQTPLPALAGYDLDAFRAVLEVNTVASLALLQLALPALRAAGGTVLAVSSDAAVEGYPGWGGYGASKAALDQLARVLAAEEPGLAVYAVDPGDMRTRMQQDAFPGEDIGDRPEPHTVVPVLRALLAARPPSGRYTAGRLLADLADPAVERSGERSAEPADPRVTSAGAGEQR